MDVNTPSYMDSWVRKNEFEDSSDLIHITDSDAINYVDFHIGEMQSSSRTSFPDDYKFVSVDVQFSADMVSTMRNTYDLLEYIGDIGGFYGGM